MRQRQNNEDKFHSQQEVLKYITEIGTSLRLDMNIDTLLKRVSEAICKALGFLHSALYLSDGAGNFRVCATTGVTAEGEAYLQRHPLPEDIVAQLISEEYRISDSYFIPAEAALWQDEVVANFFVVEDAVEASSGSSISDLPEQAYWLPEDLIVVPLVSGDDFLLGFLTPDAPLNGLRPTAETMVLLELFANQAAVVIEGARLYDEAQRISEERATLIIELREALRLAQEAEEFKTYFLMTASHELRTPLTAVQGYLELLSTFGDSIDESAKMRFLNNARRACEELILLLGNVMDTSRLDQSREQVALKMESVLVVRSVQLILEILEPMIAREKRVIEINIADNLYVWADELRLRQILLNIVGNALKYTVPPTGIGISAEIADGKKLSKRLASHILLPQHCVVIAIRDWGDGVATEDQERLFTKFMRLPNKVTSRQRGVGLGLYLCRQLTEAMGGHIWVESLGIPGEGSTFFIALPAEANESENVERG